MRKVISSRMEREVLKQEPLRVCSFAPHVKPDLQSQEQKCLDMFSPEMS